MKSSFEKQKMENLLYYFVNKTSLGAATVSFTASFNEGGWTVQQMKHSVLLIYVYFSLCIMSAMLMLHEMQWPD